MGKINKGDAVGRRSYNSDIPFKVIELVSDEKGKVVANLKGIHLRLNATAPLEDLVKIDSAEFASYLLEHIRESSERMQRIFARREREREFILGRGAPKGNNLKKKSSQLDGFDVPGTVLHIDGDNDYLDLCMTTYKQLRIPADGYCIDEEMQPKMVGELLRKHRPDLLVLTGHDGFVKGKEDFKDINNYYSSKYFVESVKEARLYEKNKDDLVIFSGACQSHYEAILSAGANFASSPLRVMIHAYDPLFVVEKIAYTSIHEPIPLKEIISGTVTGINGIGGLETRGKYRMGIPISPY